MTPTRRGPPRTRTPLPAALPLLLLALAAGLGGCGYSVGSLYGDDVETIAVDVFTNDTFRRDIELELTREVVKQVRLRTGWRIAGRGEADVVLTGRILNVRDNVLSETERNLTLESSVIITAEARLTDLKTGKLIRKVRRTTAESYLIPRGESRVTALTEAVFKLAEDLVQALEGWE
jgi:hypothetical protein